ncbi:MAG TPA: hypothetical protein VHG89_08005 [Verrucomicrobiae bacterium]|nr:hypothetical protein [Verrucomicrobiae bacterium]
MTVRNRNRLIALFIVTFPFMVIVWFLYYEKNHPTPVEPPPSLTDTNFIHDPR